MKRLHSAIGGRSINRDKNERGFVLVSAVILLTGLMFISVVSVQTTLQKSQVTGRSYKDAQTFYVAEAGAEWSKQWLYDLLEETPFPAQEDLGELTAPSINGYSFPELTISLADAHSGVVSKGAFAGMEAVIRPYRIFSHSALYNESVENVVAVTMNQESIPMGNFGIYFDQDLEFFTDYPLDYNGRIHTNGNLYLGSRNVLNIEGDVTAGKSIFNTPKDSTRSYSGKARMKDPSGHWQDLSYDSRDSEWEDKSLEDWGGRVLDQAHGIGTLPYPMPTPGEAIEIIKRGKPTDDEAMRAMRFYYKAGLKILNGAATDSLDIPIVLPAGILSTTSFYDHREQRTLTVTNLDMSLLIAYGYVPQNNVLYISESASDAAIRIINAQQLPAGGIAIATDNPLYVWKNYNTVSKKASSILCDAFNVLSNNWDDADSAKPINKRIASATSVNSCVVTGNVPTTQGSYSGGAENLIRLHEKWVGHELTYRGSLVCLWASQQATGLWIDASYVEAHRDWGFDPSLIDNRFWPEDGLTMTRVSSGSWASY
ncbi:pilus assembly PilX N-terminal domain-containing protein [bacterium]|nr:pilus assembly PilX N-terminal domain-containing protein [bacterium]